MSKVVVVESFLLLLLNKCRPNPQNLDSEKKFLPLIACPGAMIKSNPWNDQPENASQSK
jgi:hypothetical protein